MSEIKLERSPAQWAGGKASVIVEGSKAQMMYFIEDAQKDIATLSSAVEAKDAEIARLREALRTTLGALEHWYRKGCPDYDGAADEGSIIGTARALLGRDLSSGEPIEEGHTA